MHWTWSMKMYFKLIFLTIISLFVEKNVHLDRKVWLTPGKGRTPRLFRVNHVAFHHVQRCPSWYNSSKTLTVVNKSVPLELALELGVVGHLEDALLLQLLVQLTQLAHVLIQLCLEQKFIIVSINYMSPTKLSQKLNWATVSIILLFQFSIYFESNTCSPRYFHPRLQSILLHPPCRNSPQQHWIWPWIGCKDDQLTRKSWMSSLMITTESFPKNLRPPWSGCRAGSRQPTTWSTLFELPWLCCSPCKRKSIFSFVCLFDCCSCCARRFIASFVCLFVAYVAMPEDLSSLLFVFKPTLLPFLALSLRYLSSLRSQQSTLARITWEEKMDHLRLSRSHRLEMAQKGLGTFLVRENARLDCS